MTADSTAWEYETLKPPRGVTQKEASDPKAELNELGADGWELVDTVEYVGGGTKYLILKRPAEAGDSEWDANDDASDDGEDESGSDSDASDGDGDASDASTAEGQE
jgi:hypothetical protein